MEDRTEEPPERTFVMLMDLLIWVLELAGTGNDGDIGPNLDPDG